MSILYVGDTHGYVENFDQIERRALAAKASAIVQLGDFGIFWPGNQRRLVQYFEKRTRQGKRTSPWYFCDGNHDEHDVLDQLWEESGRRDVVEVAPNCFHVRRGSVVEIEGVKHIFCGGARSTDRGFGYREFVKRGKKHDRIWWPQEAPSQEDLTRFFDNLNLHKPDVVVTHDSPVCIELYRDGRNSDPTAQGFQRILQLSEHKPKRWFFGHHHTLETWISDFGVEFYCGGLHGEGWVWNPRTGTFNAKELDNKGRLWEALQAS